MGSAKIMETCTGDELEEARRPIASLIRKSAKAQQKLMLGTWQHTMLRDNLKALHIVAALMDNETNDRTKFTREDLQESLWAVAAMRSKIEKPKFSPGTSQYTLQRNRLKALRLAELVTKVELDSHDGYHSTSERRQCR